LIRVVLYFSTHYVQALIHPKEGLSLHPAYLGLHLASANQQVFEWKLSGSKCCNVKAPFAGNGKGNASHDSYLRSDWVLFSMLDYLAHMAQVQDIANGEMLR